MNRLVVHNLSGIALLLICLSATGSASDTLPRPNYVTDDIQYFEPSVQNSTDSSPLDEVIALLASDDEMIRSVKIFLLDGDSGVVLVETDLQLTSDVLSGDELLLLLDFVAGSDQVELYFYYTTRGPRDFLLDAPPA